MSRRALLMKSAAAALLATGAWIGLPGAVRAEFVYAPSPHAIRGTINGVNVVVDVRARADQMGSYLQLAMLQQIDPTHWDYVGNAPINGRTPDPNYGNAGMVWELVLSSVTSYRSPNMAKGEVTDAVTILNAQAPAMLSDWLPRMNAVLAGVYAPGKGGSKIDPVEPAKAPAPFADWQQAKDYLLAQLDGFHMVGGQIVPKGRRR